MEFVELIAKSIESWPERPSWDEYFMATTFLIASRSSCERLKVGCVLVSGEPQKNRMIAAGYNGFLPGAPHTSRMKDGHELGTVHAEQNAIADAAKRGINVQGSIAYVTHFPCINCSKILAASGVQTIKYHFDYANDPLAGKLLEEAGVGIEQL